MVVYHPYYYEGGLINTPKNVIRYTTDYYIRNSLNQSVWAEASIGKYLKWKVQYTCFMYDRQLYHYASSLLPAKVDGAGGDAKRESYKEVRHTVETTLSFKKDWKKVHYLDAVVIVRDRRDDYIEYGWLRYVDCK